MIPLRARVATRTVPVLTYALIAANTAVFLYEWSLEPWQFERFLFRFGVVPHALLFDPSWGSLATPFYSMFMHGGWFHLLSNMWFLHVFGNSLEDALGHGRYVLFFLLTGLAGVAAQVLIDPTSAIPIVGASGAIAGVLGGYVRVFPQTRVVALIPFFVFMLLRELPAVLFIFLWFFLQLLSGIGSLSAIGSQSGGVAFFAHIGGFLAGYFLVRRMRPRRNPTHGWRLP